MLPLPGAPVGPAVTGLTRVAGERRTGQRVFLRAARGTLRLCPPPPGRPAAGLLQRPWLGAVLLAVIAGPGPATAAAGIRLDRRGKDVRPVFPGRRTRPAGPGRPRFVIARVLGRARRRGQRLVGGQVAPVLVVGYAVDLIGAGPRIVVVVLPGPAEPQLRLLDLRDPPPPAVTVLLTGALGVRVREARLGAAEANGLSVSAVGSSS